MSNHSVASNSRSLSAHGTGVPSGYQQSDCGIIPIDWECRSVGSMGSVVAGKALAVSGPGTQRPYLRTKNVFDGRIDLSDVLTMPMTDSQFAVYELHAGDVLLNEGQSLELVGRCSIYHGEYGEPCAIQNQLIRFRARQDVSAEYAAHLFRHCQKTGAFAQIALQTTSIAHLGVGRFERLRLPWPSQYDEQRAIAAALSDVDELIGALDKLIAKKRAIKLATMQQLLTGKTRLPGFSGEWRTSRLEEIGEAIAGLTYSPEDVVGDGTLVLRASNIFDGELVFRDNVYVDMDLPDRVRVREGDILICVRNGSRDLIGKCAKINKASELARHVFGAFMCVFRTEFHDFVFHQFQSDVMKTQIHEHLGATINQITNKSLKAFRIPIPPREEQKAIASVLTDMDTEIAVLEKRRDKTKTIKQGMMQSLLTGRIRLVEPSVKKMEGQ